MRRAPEFGVSPHTGWKQDVLTVFDARDGKYPFAGVIADRSGSLYGTTGYGGAHRAGTIYKLTPPTPGKTTWTSQVLYSFGSGSSDGEFPEADVVADAHGVLYGTTAFGGASGYGAVFMLKPPVSGAGSWTESILHSFTNSDGSQPLAKLRAERAAAREQLYAEFVKARGGRHRYTSAWGRQRASERPRYAEITAQKRTDRDGLAAAVGAQAARTIAAAVAEHKRDELRAKIELEREELRSTLRAERAVSWREFVTERAVVGDEAAISALRGLRYQDGRDRRRSERDGFGAEGGAADARPRAFGGLAYRVQRSGAVAFYRADDPQWKELFRDEGRFIAVSTSVDAEITAALRLAAEKWGRSITITGSREFKERSLAIAVELGIEVRKRELADRQRELRRERDGRVGRAERRSPERERDRD